MSVPRPITRLSVLAFAAILGLLVTARPAADAANPPTVPTSGVVLVAKYPPDGARDITLGHVHIDGIGAVALSASRVAGRLVLTARAANGRSIGRAETVVGIGDTPLYVSSALGLRRITVQWKRDAASPRATR